VVCVSARRGWLLTSAACALAFYALLWIGFEQRWTWIGAVDRRALDAMFAYGTAHPGWVLYWNLFCTVLGPTVFRLVALVLIVVALSRRHVRTAMFLVISVELSGLITEAAKAAANRPRPVEALVGAASTSFPSGHALGVMVGVLALLTLLLPVVRRPLRVWLVLVGALVVVAIGVGRVVLCVHHPSDVLAGWALGYSWFVVCLLLVPPATPVTEVDETQAARGSSH
jgi:membrane-associated phospholipid phosphatase